MELFIPTKIYSESNCVINHADELCSLGTKAMILTGKNSAIKCGALSDILCALGRTPHILFNSVEENPSVETVMLARDIALEEGADFFIGVGGGSPMDAAKAVALMAKNPSYDSCVLYESVTLSHYPIVCIPTTCGTGAEVTHNAVLTRHALRTKKSISHRMHPALALLDSRYLHALPRSVLISTCVDALSHLLESMLNSNSNELNRCYSRQGLKLWGSFKNVLIHGEPSVDDYNNMLHSSLLGGMSIAHTGTSLPHGMSYTLTYEFGIPHGKAAGAFLGAFVERYPDEAAATEAVALLGFADCASFHAYLSALLGSVDIPKDIIAGAAQKLLQDPKKLKAFPFPLSEDFLCDLMG